MNSGANEVETRYIGLARPRHRLQPIFASLRRRIHSAVGCVAISWTVTYFTLRSNGWQNLWSFQPRLAPSQVQRPVRSPRPDRSGFQNHLPNIYTYVTGLARISPVHSNYNAPHETAGRITIRLFVSIARSSTATTLTPSDV